MADFLDLALDLKVRMVKLDLKQIEIVNMLIKTGRYNDYDKNSLITLVNFTLNGKRQGKRYQELLSEIKGVLDTYENSIL